MLRQFKNGRLCVKGALVSYMWSIEASRSYLIDVRYEVFVRVNI